ncbi:hypothetical protein V1505DRAFT_405155 [Lipomyces doorenjongii]
MKPFGCSAHILIPNARRDYKWAGKSILGIMVGYSNQSKTYRILHPHSKEIIIAPNVKFDESVFPGLMRTPIISFLASCPTQRLTLEWGASCGSCPFTDFHWDQYPLDLQQEERDADEDCLVLDNLSIAGALELTGRDVVDSPHLRPVPPAEDPMDIDPSESQ